MNDFFKNRATWLLAASGILIFVLVFHLKAVFVSLVISLTLASALAPLAEKGEEKLKLPRIVTVLLAYAVFGLIYVLMAVSLVPTIREQAHNLYEKFPEYSLKITEHYATVTEVFGSKAEQAFQISSTDARKFASQVTQQALHFTSDILSGIVSGILVLFLTAYFVIEAPQIWPKLLEWVPVKWREKAASVIRPLEGRLGGYVRGQLMVSMAVACFLGCGMYLIGVPHALVLAVLSGLLNLVPFVGSMLTAVLAVLVAFNQSLLCAGLTVGLFAVEQWVESNFIVPRLLGSQVELHPLIVLFAILIGASLMGLPGALIAVPLTTATMYLAEEFYLKPLKEKEEQEAGSADA
ncbi:MAG: AI-2E family transporter [Cyanobacteria bacterium HKST-UBA02]|nr:AI-2E family transporter [Cyanobacteria bacterium HKST-UBA02]